MVTKAKNPAKATTSKSAKKKASALATQAAKTKALSLATRERKLASLLALIRRRKDRIVEDFYDIGEALRTILRDDLARARNTTFDVLVGAELGIEPSTAYKLIGVVEALPRERAIALGQEKSYALVTYAAATAAPDTPLELAERDAKIGRKPISIASANEIKRAATALRSRKKARPRDRERDTSARVAASRARGPRSDDCDPSRGMRARVKTILLQPSSGPKPSAMEQWHQFGCMAAQPAASARPCQVLSVALAHASRIERVLGRARSALRCLVLLSIQ